MISLWVNERELRDYMKGCRAVGWASHGEFHPINLLVPVDHIDTIEESESGPTEIWFMK